ncbi:hypothetical protein ACIQTU_07030 [Brevundimonas sp. NPDC090276]|uniref:hypothetical protein n=1 Tax=Brevundimonas sp. NPDC090276 TaxID=3363956 RepID=UPI00383AEB8E
MSDFPVQYDADAGIIQLHGKGGASVMLAFLLKAKFGEALDPEVLFHPDLAAIMIALRARGVQISETEGPFDRVALQSIAGLIVRESWRSGWWQKSRDEQVAFIENVIVAPHRLSAEQIEDLFEDIESDLQWRRRIVEAADAAKVS